MSLDRCGAIADALRLSPPPFDSPASWETEPGEVYETPHPQRKPRRNAFGRADLADAYRKAKDLLIEHKLFRIAQYEELGDTRRLTICNLWRIERLPDASLRTLEFRLTTGVWEEVSTLEHWPEVPFYPIKKTQSLDWWRSVARQAIWKALVAAGYFNLPRFHTEIADWDHDQDGYPVPAKNAKKEMSPSRMAYLLIERYIGRQGAYNNKRKTYDWKPGLLDPDSMMSGARALRAAFFQHFLDREVLSAMLAIDYRDSAFLRYLRYARLRPALVKVATEHRNLLPLLPGINPEQWGRDDLFSRKLWVRDGRKSTALDRRPIRLAKGQGVQWQQRAHYQSFEVAAAWRWLSKASAVVVREWAGKNNTIIANLALANVSAKAPVYAYVQIVREAHRLDRYGVSPRIQQLLRLFLAHCAKLWKDKGYTEVRLWLRDNNQSSLSVMLDYLDAEGFEQGFPDKHSTWAALLRRSDDWHRRIAIERMEQELDGLKMLDWASLVRETVIDDIVFTPLNDSRALAVEGYEMHHCVGQYAGWCHRGKYRAYSVREPDGSRSTLGFEIRGRKVIWDQHMSKYNGPVSPAAHHAGRQLAATYQQALEAAKPKRQQRGQQ